MGFTKDSIRRTLFDLQSYKAAIAGSAKSGGYAVVSIVPTRPRNFSDKDGGAVYDHPIVGIAQEGLVFSVDANWTEMGQMSSLVTDNPIVQNVLNVVNPLVNIGGYAELGAVWKSKKVYQKSGDIKVSVKMKIVDWMGTGQPILCSRLLASYCLPENNFQNTPLGSDKNFQDFTTSITNFVTSATEGLTEGVKIISFESQSRAQNNNNAADKAIAGKGGEALSTAAMIGGNILAGATEGINDLWTLRSSPVPVKLKIGQYFFHKDMVINKVDFTFSKECTIHGPLYVDINIDLSSRHILSNIDDVGFVANIAKKGERVSFWKGGL